MQIFEIINPRYAGLNSKNEFCLPLYQTD